MISDFGSTGSVPTGFSNAGSAGYFIQFDSSNFAQNATIDKLTFSTETISALSTSVNGSRRGFGTAFATEGLV